MTTDLLDAVKFCLEINLGSFKSKLVLAQCLQLTAMTQTIRVKLHAMTYCTHTRRNDTDNMCQATRHVSDLLHTHQTQCSHCVLSSVTPEFKDFQGLFQ